MKRVLFFAIVVVLLFFGIRTLVLALVSDETKIAWLIEEMEEGFDDGSAKSATSGLAHEWRHEDAEVDRDTLRALLAREFMVGRQNHDGELIHRVELPEQLLEITVTDDTAAVRCEAIFERLRDEEWSVVWRARIEVELVKVEGEWEIHASRHEDLEGRGLRR